MTTAGVGTRRQLHQLAEGNEEVAVTYKRKMNYGRSEAWLWEDCGYHPGSLGKFPHLHRFIVCFPLHVTVAFQMSTESIGNVSQLFPRQNLLDVMQVASGGNFWMSVANLSWI